MEDKLEAIIQTIESRKASGVDEIPLVVRKTRKFDDLLLRFDNLSEEGELRIFKKHGRITLIAIVAEVFF